jgi:hypothetical protein
MHTEETKSLLAMVQAGNLEGAAAAIKSMMNKKKDAMMAEAKAFMGNSLLNGEDCAEEEPKGA